MRPIRIAGLALALVLAACSGDAASTTTDATTPSSTSGEATTSTTDATTTSADATTTSDATTTTEGSTTSSPESTTAPTGPVPDEDLPGEFFDLNPVPGSILAVVGVAHDDVLNVRLRPGADQAIVATLGPVSNEFEATGRGRLLPNSIWYEGTTATGVVGWVSSRFTSQIGETVDLTSMVVEDLGGTIPTAADMEALGRLVAESQASTDPQSDIVMVVAPTVGDLGEVTFDVVGLGDDAVWALRLHVFGEPTDGGFSLKSVEATSMCVGYRGVTDEGICV